MRTMTRGGYDPNRRLTKHLQSLVEQWIPFARKRASVFSDLLVRARPWLCRREVYEEMSAAACEGLVTAAQRFKPDFRLEGGDGFVKFSTYAGWYILQSMQDYSRHLHPISPNFCPKGGAPRKSDRPIQVTRISRDTESYTSEANKDLFDVADQPVETMAGFEELIAGLRRRDKAILRMKYLLDMTYEDIGRFVGLSKERVRQILDAAYEKISEKKGINPTEVYA